MGISESRTDENVLILADFLSRESPESGLNATNVLDEPINSNGIRISRVNENPVPMDSLLVERIVQCVNAPQSVGVREHFARVVHGVGDRALTMEHQLIKNQRASTVQGSYLGLHSLDGSMGNPHIIYALPVVVFGRQTSCPPILIFRSRS